MSCITCKHYKLEGNCMAFPSGIPLAFVSGEKLHNTIIDEQFGSTLYESGKNDFNTNIIKPAPQKRARMQAK